MRDLTLVLRVWLEPDNDEPRGRLLTSEGDDERTALGRTDIVGLVDTALAAFLARGD